MVSASVKEKVIRLMEKISENLRLIDETTVNRMIKAILRTTGDRRIFVVGAGRSGLVGRAFAMRLMHIGLNVYVVGETITPPIKTGDLLIAISGSGETRYTTTIAQEAKKLGAYVVAITSYPESMLGSTADLKVIIPGRVLDSATRDYEARQISGEHEPLTPLGTLFELSSMIFLDALISELAYRLGKSEEDMASRHASL